MTRPRKARRTCICCGTYYTSEVCWLCEGGYCAPVPWPADWQCKLAVATKDQPEDTWAESTEMARIVSPIPEMDTTYNNLMQLHDILEDTNGDSADEH